MLVVVLLLVGGCQTVSRKITVAPDPGPEETAPQRVDEDYQRIRAMLREYANQNYYLKNDVERDDDISINRQFDYGSEAYRLSVEAVDNESNVIVTTYLCYNPDNEMSSSAGLKAFDELNWAMQERLKSLFSQRFEVQNVE